MNLMGLGRFQFTKADLLKIAREAAFAGIGALALSLLGGISGLDLGLLNNMKMLAVPWLINAINRWLRDNNINK